MLDYVVYLPLAVPLSVERVKVTGTLLIPCFTIFRVATRSASLTVTSERLKVITTAVVQCEHVLMGHFEMELRLLIMTVSLKLLFFLCYSIK